MQSRPPLTVQKRRAIISKGSTKIKLRSTPPTWAPPVGHPWFHSAPTFAAAQTTQHFAGGFAIGYPAPVTWIAIAATIALAAPLAAAVANVAAHWQRASPQLAGQRRIPAKLSVRGLIDEAIATILASVGPIAYWAPQRHCPPTPGLPPVALLEDRRTTTASWLLQRRLRGAGWRVIPILRTTSRPTDAKIDGIARTVLDSVGTDTPITLVGIGTSGLLARQLAARHPRFTRVVTVATPHQGTLSRTFPRTVRPQAPLIAEAAAVDPQPRSFDAVALYSDGDAWIDPTAAAYYPGAFNLEVHDIGHLSMLFSQRVFGYIEENLAAPLPRDAQ